MTEKVEIGASEHDQEMIKIAEQSASSQQAPQEQAPQESQEQRPEWLDDQFKSGEDLAKSYKELQAELTRMKQSNKTEAQGQPEEQQTTPENTQDKSEEKPTDDTNALDFDKFTQEVYQDGKLSDESLEALKAAGIPEQMIQTHVDAVKFQNDKNQQSAKEQGQSLLDSVGGQDKYNEIIQWASKDGNISVDLATKYNEAVDSGDVTSAKLLLSNIQQSYSNSQGYEGNNIKAVPAQNSKGDVYASKEEAMADMNDIRYKGKGSNFFGRDRGFVKQVEAKIARSNFNF